MNCKSMLTPMVTNLKKLSEIASDSDLVDPTMYKQWIRSSMISFLRAPGANSWLSWGSYIRLRKACVEVPVWYSRIWFQIRLWWWSEATWFYRLSLGGNAVDRWETFECCFSLGLAMVFWFSWKQTFVALSIEEYIAISVTSCKDYVSSRGFLQDWDQTPLHSRHDTTWSEVALVHIHKWEDCSRECLPRWEGMLMFKAASVNILLNVPCVGQENDISLTCPTWTRRMTYSPWHVLCGLGEITLTCHVLTEWCIG